MTLYWSCVNHATFALEVYYHKIICCQEKPERLNCILFSIWNTKTSNILQFGKTCASEGQTIDFC